MGHIDLELLGMTKEDLQTRVVERIAQSLMAESTTAFDNETGDSYESTVESRAMKALKSLVRDRIDGKIRQIGDSLIVPRVDEMILTASFTKTNQWGEKKGETLSFTEYLVQRAEAYLAEPVDYNGKARAEDAYGSWKASGTRVAYLVDKYLQHSVETAMKEAVKNANDVIVGGLAETVKIKLAEVVKMLKVTVQTK